jgi:hypothetical protein
MGQGMFMVMSSSMVLAVNSIHLEGQIHTGRALFLPSLPPMNNLGGEPVRFGDGGGGPKGDRSGQ